MKAEKFTFSTGELSGELWTFSFSGSMLVTNLPFAREWEFGLEAPAEALEWTYFEVVPMP